MTKNKLSLLILFTILIFSFSNIFSDITIKTKDGYKVTVKEEVAKQSGLLSGLMEEAEEEEEVVPTLNINKKEFDLIHSLMQLAVQFQKKGKLDLEIKRTLASKVKRYNLTKEKLALLFNAANYLDAEKILSAICFYLIGEDPEKYLTEEDPLGFRKIGRAGVVMAYQNWMKESVRPYMMATAHKKGFNDWFEKAEKIPGFAEKIAFTVWGMAVAGVAKGGKEARAFFGSIEEENLLRLAVEMAFFKKYKKRIGKNIFPESLLEYI